MDLPFITLWLFKNVKTSLIAFFFTRGSESVIWCMHEQQGTHACGVHLKMIGQNVIKHVRGGKNWHLFEFNQGKFLNSTIASLDCYTSRPLSSPLSSLKKNMWLVVWFGSLTPFLFICICLCLFCFVGTWQPSSHELASMPSKPLKLQENFNTKISLV